MNEKLSISKLNFYDNEVKAVVDITNNPVLKKYGFAVMNVTMDISDADCIDYSLKGSLLKRNKQSIGGDYTFMKGIQMGSDVIITTECAREVEKCVKYLFSKYRKRYWMIKGIKWSRIIWAFYKRQLVFIYAV